jgi:plasmid stabilization system protein ParE
VAHRLEWPIYVLLDLDEIATEIAQDSPERGKAFVRRVFQAAERLKHMPFSGRIVPEHGMPHIREIIVKNHRVIYLVMDDMIEFWMVIHSARSFPPDHILDRKTLP